MALPSENPASATFPLGFETVSISAVSYIVDAVDLVSTPTRNIVRTDEYGDFAEVQTRLASEPAEGTLTLQRELTTTALPSAGTEFTYDFDRSGTGSTLRVTDVKVNRSKDAADVIEVGVILISYQS